MKKLLIFLEVDLVRITRIYQMIDGVRLLLFFTSIPIPTPTYISLYFFLLWI